MIVTLIPYCPRSEGQNLGYAYNELMNRLQDDDWACFIDHDACFTTYDWYAQLEEITAGRAEPCVLTALTNRVGSRWQLAPGVDRGNHSMDYHRRVGVAIQSGARCSLRDVTDESLMSGVVILLSKRTWARLGGFASGFLGVDNAIHQAARDQGCRVYLMEGVYVYHWYRADALPNGEAASSTVNPHSPIEETRLSGSGSAPVLGAADLVPAVWECIPIGGQRILLIGSDIGCAGEWIKSQSPAALSVVEMDPSALEDTRQRCGEASILNDKGTGVEFAAGSFDVIVAPGLFEQVRRPGHLLKDMHRWIGAGGRLTTTFHTVRSASIVDGLLSGRWLAAGDQNGARRPIRYYTRREVEKLIYRAGFAPEKIEPLAALGHSEWGSQTRSGSVRFGRLAVDGLSARDAEEFYARGFLLEAVPVGDPGFGLTSIVIITCNQLEYTRQCVESIRRLTDEPYELIFIDNGSTDGTVPYLEAVPGAKVIRNSANRGFPAAANQGIAAAVGEQVLLLNNDTVVTTGWLRRMLVALNSDPRIGLVGPCSNFVGSEQQIETSYDSLAGLDAFAWEWGKANDRRMVETKRLIGFCLLIRRAVIEAVGVMDERFGIGCFEDDDYCLRTIVAGWRAVIAQDAFIQHFGGRTFTGNGLDVSAILHENQERFREKWGLASPATGSPAGSVPVSPQRSTSYSVTLAPEGGLLLCSDRPRISLCMIVRDSAPVLRPCLESIRPWVDEMVIVDTGSLDETPRIVEELGGRLFHFPWCDDFSAARNESLRHARGDWVFWMDSDDTIPAECGRQLRALVESKVEPDVLGFVMQVHCPGGGEDGNRESDVTVVDHVKLFRNRPDLRFEGRIHEQILPAIRRAGGTVSWTKTYVVHSGSDPSPEAQDRKRRRDLHLLHLELRERPEHPFTLFNLGMTYADGNRFEEARGFLRRSLEHSSPDESHLRKVYSLLVYTEMRLGRHEEAFEVCRRGRALFPEDAELQFRQGVLLQELGNPAEAVRAYRDVLANHEARHFNSIDRGVTGFKARQNLAVAYTDLGDLRQAEEEWRQVTREMPCYRAGWRGLGEVLLRAGRYQEVRTVAEQCLREPGLRSEGWLLRSRLALAVGDIAAARVDSKQAVAEAPTDRAALEGLCHLLFDHGPASEAERALRSLIELDPGDGAAHHNLGLLLMRFKRYDEAVRSFRQSLRHRANYPATYLHLGRALKESGRLGEAITAWQQVLRLAPGDPAAHEELSWAAHQRTRAAQPAPA